MTLIRRMAPLIVVGLVACDASANRCSVFAQAI